MRNCQNMIKRLKMQGKEFEYIKQLVSEDKELFLAIRENYMNIYYMGGSLAKIGFDKDRKVYFELHQKYVNGEGIGYVRLSLDEHKEKVKLLKENIKKIALSNQEGIKDKDIVHKKVAREKICQQWIINKNNVEDGEWYYLDMEYTMKGIPSGRFDMIAVKKKPDNNNKHQVALVELKIGDERYTSMTNAKYYDEKNYDKYLEIKEKSLYNFQKKEEHVSFGSGLLGHLCDYMRFLYGNHYEVLKEELVLEIKSLIELEIISSESSIGKIIDSGMLSDKPEIYFVSYTKVPSLMNDREMSIEDMKETFYKYMYSSKEKTKNQIDKKLSCSIYSVQDVLNVGEIKGLLDIEPDFFHMVNPSFSLHIGETDYQFKCIFMDANKVKSWECL